MRTTRGLAPIAVAAAVALSACQQAAEVVELGPADGHDLPGIDLERIQVGNEGPDFSLLSFRGDTVTLSDYRGQRNIILVFYRGSW